MANRSSLFFRLPLFLLLALPGRLSALSLSLCQHRLVRCGSVFSSTLIGFNSSTKHGSTKQNAKVLHRKRSNGNEQAPMSRRITHQGCNCAERQTADQPPPHHHLVLLLGSSIGRIHRWCSLNSMSPSSRSNQDPFPRYKRRDEKGCILCV